MYRKKEETKQQEFVDFYLSFGGKLDPGNKWIRLAQIIPWEIYETEYAKLFSEVTGTPAKPFRVALGALLIKTIKGITDEAVVEELKENPYLQYLIGLKAYQYEAPFDASMMVHFRKRISTEMLQEINEKIVQLQLEKQELQKKKKRKGKKPSDDPKNSGTTVGSEETSESAAEEEIPKNGKLLLDATCAPADIRYPTDIALLNEAREKSEEIIDQLYKEVKDRINKPRTYRNVARKAFLQVSRNRKPSRKVIRKGIKKQLQYLRRNITYITELSKESPLTGLSRKLYRNLLVLQEVYRQQSEMFEEKKHSVTGRIVSISQPHVRPIVRGKAKAPVEFGAKISVSRVDGYAYLETISWEPYHEGNLLKEHITVYKKRFGYYPKSVLADKIYRTRENLRFCKELGIRLAGPPLGRPPKDKAVYKAILQEAREDEKQRVPIEGVFGRAKRKYGMGLIKEKLQNTSENTLAMIILGMNLEKILGNLFVLLNQFIGEMLFQPIFRWKLAEKS